MCRKCLCVSGASCFFIDGLMRKLLFLLFGLFVFAGMHGQGYDAYLLGDSVYAIDEVEVVATRRSKDIKGLTSGRLELNLKELQSLPKFLGAVDLFRTMQLTPGVQTAGELNSGLYVRGCDSGHNRILFNGATVYSPVHLVGFFSVFNSSHISSASLIKSNVSADYGGRLSGVVDVRSKDAVADRFSMCGDFGLVSSQGTVTMPLGDNSSLYLSGRGSYVNLLLGLVDMKEDGIKPRYGFMDYNMTFVAKPGRGHSIIANAYYGRDRLSLKEYYYQVEGNMEWQNAVASLQWDWDGCSGRKAENVVYYTFYDNMLDAFMGGSVMKFPSRIQDVGYRGHFATDFLGGNLEAGGEYVRHSLDPQYPFVEDLYTDGSSVKPSRMVTHEYGVYVRDRFSAFGCLDFDLGLRYSGSVQESRERGRNESGRFYHGLEPRASLSYQFRPGRRFALSYALQRQYMNQVVVSGIGLPTDFWLPASVSVPAQSANSLSLGYFHSTDDNDFEFSVEGYYKRLLNQLEFSGELFDLVNQTYHVEDHLLYGNGHSYGVEFMLKKNSGRLNGWLSYTLGRSVRSFPDINDGSPFPAKNDRRHDLSLVVNYKLDKHWTFSGVFVYATGNAFTMPVSLYLVGENAVNEYGPHNGARMPAYHRLDLSATYWFKKTADKESCINISLYNAYARQNPIFLTAKVGVSDDRRRMKIIPKGQSLYSLVPSISYSFRF